MEIHNRFSGEYDHVLDSLDYLVDYILHERGFLPMVTVYWSPADYPDKAVARVSVIGADHSETTRAIMLADSLDELRLKIPQSMVPMPRQPEDDPCIVEVWI